MGSKLHNFDEAKNTFGHNLLLARKKKGFRTQEAFAEEMGVAVDTVRNWEQGRTFPEMGTIFRICSSLDCDMDYLIGRLDAPTHDLAFIQEKTRLSEAAVNKLLQIAFYDRATGNSKTLSRFIENDDFGYLIALLNAKIGKGDLSFSTGNAYLQVDQQAIIRHERDSLFHDIAKQMEASAEAVTEQQIMYKLAYGLFAEGRLTEPQLLDVIDHFDRGDYDYSPPQLRKKS